MASEDFGGAFWPLPLRLGPGWMPEQHARLCADLAAVRRTLPHAQLTVNQDAGSPFAASVTTYLGQNGAGLGYAPTVAVTGEGDVTLTWPSYWTDDYEIQHPVKIRQAIAMSSATGVRFPVVTLLPHAVRVRTKDLAGNPIASPFSLRIW